MSASVLARRPGTIYSCSRPCGVLQSGSVRCCSAFPENLSSEIVGRGCERTVASVTRVCDSGGRIGRANHPDARRGGNGPGGADDGSRGWPGQKMMWNYLQNGEGWRAALEILILAVGHLYIFRFLRGTRGWPVVIGFVVLLLRSRWSPRSSI